MDGLGAGRKMGCGVVARYKEIDHVRRTTPLPDRTQPAEDYLAS